jgi:hypothetical protein
VNDLLLNSSSRPLTGIKFQYFYDGKPDAWMDYGSGKTLGVGDEFESSLISAANQEKSRGIQVKKAGTWVKTCLSKEDIKICHLAVFETWIARNQRI